MNHSCSCNFEKASHHVSGLGTKHLRDLKSVQRLSEEHIWVVDLLATFLQASSRDE